MSWQVSLAHNYTDGSLILPRGKIVYERYFEALTPANVHAVMSLTKSVTGTLGAMLVAEGRLDENRTVGSYLPELRQLGFGDTTVRQVLDMTTALQFSEDDANPKAEVWQFSQAGNPLPKPADHKLLNIRLRRKWPQGPAHLRDTTFVGLTQKGGRSM